MSQTVEGLSPEGIPTTKVYPSFNGKIVLGGFTIIRVQRATLRVGINNDIYPEVGKRSGVVYTRNFTVRLTISRAYINGAEWKLAIGMGSGNYGYEPGREYSGDDLATLIESHSNWMSHRYSTNNYPIKFDAQLEINTDKVPNANDVGAVIKPMYAKIKGLMIDSISLNIGRSGDIIMNDPIEMIGEMVAFELSQG